MTTPSRARKLFGPIVGLIALTFTLALFWAAQGPDFDLSFSREVPSELSPARLDRNLFSLARWPQWFFNLSDATVLNVDPQGGPEQDKIIRPGSLIKLTVDTQKTLAKNFFLTAQVLEYRPGQILRIQIVDDSSGRFPELFSIVEWKIEFLPKGDGSVIRGSAIARTKHWRARLFGRMAEKILMYQLFYPDLMKLSELKQPFSSGLDPQLKPKNSTF